jgi:hypothetical protein
MLMLLVGVNEIMASTTNRCPTLQLNNDALPRIWSYERDTSFIGLPAVAAMPLDRQHLYTRNGSIPSAIMYVDDTGPDGHGSHYKYKRSSIDHMITSATRMRQSGNAGRDQWLFDALRLHPIDGKHVAGTITSSTPTITHIFIPYITVVGIGSIVFGSMEPWYESIALAHGASHGNSLCHVMLPLFHTDSDYLLLVTTIEYNQLTYEHASFTVVTPDQGNQSIFSCLHKTINEMNLHMV